MVSMLGAFSICSAAIHVLPVHVHLFSAVQPKGTVVHSRGFVIDTMSQSQGHKMVLM